LQTGAPSTLEPAGPQAAWIADIWWLELTLATLVFGLVLGALLYALFRQRPPQPQQAVGPGTTPYLREPTSRFANSRFVIAGGVFLPVVVLVPLFTYAVVLLRWLAAPGATASTEIEVIGHQYWWTVRYPGHQFATANEIHLPVGQPVRLSLTSTDVIHSFWVPQLMGKQDMLPGRQIETWIQADRPGLYWGQCAELCGVQHAKMAFVVAAEPPDEFERWVEQQRRPAVEPADPQTQRGAQVFARQGCIACHAVRYGSTPTGGEIGPDLTHVGSRLTLAAGVLENNRGNLSGWIANPQALKPGNNMPAVPLSADDLLAVAAYLESLK
jgi:cytochrome c oxidase subunit 2